MSTRCSIVYVAGLHIYRECNSDEICIERRIVEYRTKEEGERHFNEKYDDPIISREELALIRDEISNFLGDKAPALSDMTGASKEKK